MRFSMVALAIICIAGGALLLPVVYSDFLKVAEDAVLRGKDYVTVVFGALR